MAKTVNQAFNELVNDVLAIPSSKRQNANDSANALKNQIDSLSEKGLIPKTCPSQHYLFGSFSRKTKNTPLNDVDLIICFDACSSLTIEGNSWDNLKLTLTGSDKRLLDLCDKSYPYGYYSSNSKCELNSNKFKNKLVTALSNVQYYKKAELHARGEAVTLDLSSYDWSFDVVPAFFYFENEKTIYLIPNGNGRWKKTCPEKERKRIDTLDSLFKGMTRKMVRLVKYWNKRGKMPTITSYVMETMVLDFFSGLSAPEDSEILYLDFLFRDFLNYVERNIYRSINDSKGIEGDINNLVSADRFKLSLRARNDYQKAKNAISAEIDETNTEKSINIWRDIFGEEFPPYE